MSRPAKKSRENYQVFYPRSSGVRKLLASRFLQVTACLLLIAIASIWIWRWLSNTSPVTKGVALLTAAYLQERTTEARISGFSHAPFLARRGGEEARVDYVERDRAERLLLDEVSEQPGAEAHHALGKSYLAKGSVDKAIDQFQQALKQDANNAELHSDLGVALFEMSGARDGKHKSDRTFELLAQSFEQIDQALQLDPRNREALFNRALLLPYMKLSAEAKLGWETYLSQETQAGWMEEGKRNLRLLNDSSLTPATVAEVIDGFLSAAEGRDRERAWQVLSENKEMITGMFIPQELGRVYLNEGSGPQNPARALAALRIAGQLEMEKSRDPFVSEIAEYYAGVTASQRAILREAQASLLSGYSSCLKPDYKGALPAFEKSRKLFHRAGDEWEARISDYWIAYCASQLPNQLSKSTASLLSLSEYCERKNYHWLLSQAVCWLANNYTELGQHSDSVQSYNRALAIAESTNDNYIKQKILSQLGNEYNLMGQPALALEYHWRSLQLINSRYTSVRQVWRNFLYIARTLIALKMYGAAKAYSRGMLDLARDEIKKPGFVHFSNIYLAQIYGGERNFEPALQLARESLEIAQALADPKLAAGSLRLIAHLQRQAGRLPEALSTYDQAIKSLEQMDDLKLYNYEARKGRLICYAALNDSQRFEAELPYVLNQFEEYRVKIREEQNRNTFFDSEQSVYDLAIDHAEHKGDALLALDYSEKSRARSLLTSLTNQDRPYVAITHPGNAGSVSLNVPDIQARMPPNVQIVEYAVLKDRMVIWLISQSVFKSITTKISSDDLRERISKYVTVIASGPGAASDLEALAREIYEIAIAPIAQDLDAGKVLCIVPDKALSYLPFATLVSPRSGQYLIREYAFLSSPSLQVFLQTTETSRLAGSRKSETVLTVGNPEFDPRDYPDLPNLPAAAREAEQIAQLYAGSMSLIGSKAVKSSIDKLLPKANVLHFAGHYIMNERYPLLSRLVLAKTDGAAEKDLMTGDLVGMRLARTHLVVLSACQTGGEKYYNGEGLMGISRAFLEKGIPLVIASQWPVESESTSQLMVTFHRYRREVSSVEALRKSQLEMLSEANGPYRHPYYWAAFVPVGGYAEF